MLFGPETFGQKAYSSNVGSIEDLGYLAFNV